METSSEFEFDIEPKKSKKIKWIVIAVIIIAIFSGGLFFTVKAIIDSGITKGPDHMFGDQHLKTAVALVELHNIRYGGYPGSLSDLKFRGNWDTIALSSVLYCPNQERTAYFIEVTRGWVGKPSLLMQKEFWQGTGYEPLLISQCGN